MKGHKVTTLKVNYKALFKSDYKLSKIILIDRINKITFDLTWENQSSTTNSQTLSVAIVS